MGGGGLEPSSFEVLRRQVVEVPAPEGTWADLGQSASPSKMTYMGGTRSLACYLSIYLSIYLELQVYKPYLLWGLKCICRTYFGLLGALRYV